MQKKNELNILIFSFFLLPGFCNVHYKHLGYLQIIFENFCYIEKRVVRVSFPENISICNFFGILIGMCKGVSRMKFHGYGKFISWSFVDYYQKDPKKTFSVNHTHTHTHKFSNVI